MDKAKEYLIEEITIDRAVEKLIEEWGSDEATTIEALHKAILINDVQEDPDNSFYIYYKEDKITIPDEESKHIDCFMWGVTACKYLLEVAKNGWGEVCVKPGDCGAELTTKTKGEKVIVPKEEIKKRNPKTGEEKTTCLQKEVRENKEVTERYMEPILFRKFKVKIDLFKEMLNKNNLSIPKYWVSEGGERVGKENNISTGLKRKNKYAPRGGTLGVLMLNLAETFAKNRNGAVIGGHEMLSLLKKNGATVKSSDKEYVKSTDTITKKVIKVSKTSFEGRLTRIRNHIREKYPT